MIPRLFTFSASSVTLDESIESFLRSRGTILIDFGNSAYIDSEMMPRILSELLIQSNHNALSLEAVASLEAKIKQLQEDRDNIVNENIELRSQVERQSTEIATLKTFAIPARDAKTTPADNANFPPQAENKSQVFQRTDPDEKQNVEKLQLEVQKLRSQNIEAITSLKVLEDENDELRRELDGLKKRPKEMPASTTT